MLIILIFFPALVFITSIKGIVIGVNISEYPVIVKHGWIYPFLGIYFVVYLAAIFYTLIKKRKVHSGIQKTQLNYFFVGTFLFLSVAIITNLIAPLVFNNDSLTRYGPASSIFLSSIISYAIFKHRLFDIAVIIRKVTILGILLMIILGVFSMVAFGLPFVFADSLPEDTFQITLVAVAFIVALFFQPLRRSIEEFTDRWFFKGAYKPQQVIDELSEKISTIIDLRVLLDATAQILLKAFRSEHAVFSVREKIGRAEKDAESAEQKFIAYNTEGRHRPMEEFTYDSKNPFVRYFNKYTGEVIIRDELQKDLEESGSVKHESGIRNHGKGKRERIDVDMRLRNQVLKEMENHEFAIIFPVFSKEELVGIFGLGAKKSGDIYAHQDLQILELFSHQVGIAVENAKLYADLKLFNEKLQFEVEKATQDLRITNSQLNLRNKDLGALQKITNLITRTLDLASITQTIADSISTELGYIGGIIYFYDKEKKELKVQAITQTPLTKKAISLLPKSPFDYAINVEKDNNLNAQAANAGEVRLDANFENFIHPPVPKLMAQTIQKVMGMKSIVALPIFVENEVIGVINFGLAKNKGEITDQELQMMRALADQMGIIIRNVRLYEAVKGYSKKLEEANEYLEELDKTKSEFISIASHQFRSPLTGIKGYLAMLLDGDFGALDEKKKSVMAQMLDSAERLIRLINVFLNVSRIEAGRLHLDKRETHIEEVIKSVITEMIQPAKKKGLELEFHEPKEKIVPFMADPDKLRDVILNFVDNAIKYTPSGKVWVGTRLAPRPKQLQDKIQDSSSKIQDASSKSQDSGVVVRINDTGMGLDPEDAKKLFDKFSRVKGIAQVNPDGSGLGLYITKKLSEAHGGGVWVESKGKGKGSSFCLWVPVENH